MRYPPKPTLWCVTWNLLALALEQSAQKYASRKRGRRVGTDGHRATVSSMTCFAALLLHSTAYCPNNNRTEHLFRTFSQPTLRRDSSDCVRLTNQPIIVRSTRKASSIHANHASENADRRLLGLRAQKTSGERSRKCYNATLSILQVTFGVDV